MPQLTRSHLLVLSVPMTLTLTLALALALAAALLPVGPGPALAQDDAAPVQTAPEHVEVIALSNRADLVSGDDVLIEVRLPEDASHDDVTVDVDGTDVTDAFAVRQDGQLAGLVDGLAVGANTITAELPDGRGARLTVDNHPVGGPIFSGPQIQPWYCLPDATDEQCNRPTEISWQYKSATTGQFAAYDPDAPPSDVATTTTDEGEEVPYIVRVETGNADRSQYRIAVLTTPEEEWDRWSGPTGWNHKVYVPHGAGCGMGHSEGAAPDVLLDIALSRGFAVMSTALEHNTENCNVVVQAESVMMAKEHLVESYGDIRYLFGTGCSGGSIAQLHMANAYPGLYDGLTVSCTYPDIPTLDLLDCPALAAYFTNPSRWAPGVAWPEAQMAQATSQQSFSVCLSWLQTFSIMFDPTTGVDCDIPAQEPEIVYHPEDNPTGVRCSFQDYLVNLYGTRPESRWGPVEQEIGEGFAGRPYDNVGLQYGLRALLEGTISPAQFVDLNASIGAMDIDYAVQPERVEGDPEAIRIAYRSGVLNEANNLDRVPIIDMPIPADRYEFHDNYKSWDLRQRLINANGHADNHLIWYGPDEQGLGFAQAAQPFETMDAWLTAVEADDRDVPLEEKVVDNRPEGAGDRCDVPDEAICDLVFGSAGHIRYGAGAPSLANDVIKCQLKPLVRNDYAPVHFTDDQWARLQEAFPTGVCDWTKPGVGQAAAVAWLEYTDGPGGQPLGQPPRSIPFGPQASAVSRVAGDTRYTTAVALSQDVAAADTVVLASGAAFADALAGAPLATSLDAPLLLTPPDELPAEVAEEISRLGAARAVVLGGEAAVAERVVDQLDALGLDVRRIGGATRFHTAAAIAADLAPSGARQAVVVRGDAFADAVAASGLAAVQQIPLLLVTPSSVPEPTAGALQQVSSITIVGGEAAVGPDVAETLTASGAHVARLAGEDRYATSAAVGQLALQHGASPAVTHVATGHDFADALVAGAAAGRTDGLLLLVDGRDPDGAPAVHELLAQVAEQVAELRIVGGPAAVSEEVAAALAATVQVER